MPHPLCLEVGLTAFVPVCGHLHEAPLRRSHQRACKRDESQVNMTVQPSLFADAVVVFRFVSLVPACLIVLASALSAELIPPLHTHHTHTPVLSFIGHKAYPVLCGDLPARWIESLLSSTMCECVPVAVSGRVGEGALLSLTS